MIRASKFYGAERKVLEDITLAFLPGAKIGVLGANGAGKSTLLRIMAGCEELSSGRAELAAGATVGLLQQEPELNPGKDVRGNVEEGVGRLRDLLTRFEEISAAFTEPDADFDALLAEQATVQEQIERADAWSLDATIDRAIDALRLPDGDRDVTTLSGGERRRVALARLLLSTLISCCSTSRRTISTPSRSRGSSASSPTTREPLSPSHTTGTSSTTWRAGSSSSIAGKASRTRETTQAGWSRTGSPRRRGEARIGAPTRARARAGMDASLAEGTPRKGEGARLRLPEAARR